MMRFRVPDIWQLPKYRQRVVNTLLIQERTYQRLALGRMLLLKCALVAAMVAMRW